MESGPSTVRIPTLPLAEERLIEIDRLLALPSELQWNILSKMGQTQLLNVCMINSNMLSLCWDPYLATLKQWTKKEFIIFQLKLLANCKYKECQSLKYELNKPLIQDTDFITEYNKVINNAEIIYYPGSKITHSNAVNDPIDILLNTQKIVFEDEFDQLFDLHYFINITHLYFGNLFNQPIERVVQNTIGSLAYESVLPNSITNLIFEESSYFNQSVDYLPNSITHLEFGEKFNQSVDNLPNSITNLIFGNNFNQPVDHLPNSITHLTFGEDFNQPVGHLPNSITDLTFGDLFNQQVGHLPNSIISLTFGGLFNQSVDHLPNSIIHLYFHYLFDQKINKLPSSLQYLTIGTFYTYRSHLLTILSPTVTVYYVDEYDEYFDFDK